MEKIWIKKELYILNYEFLKFYALFPYFIWFLFDFYEFSLFKNCKKGGKLTAGDDVASGPRRRLTWRAEPPRGATRH